MRAKLTDRQFEVAVRLAAGWTNAEIASDLGIDTKTVDTHRAAALKRLHVRNNVELARYAIGCGASAPPMIVGDILQPVSVIAFVPSGDRVLSGMVCPECGGRDRHAEDCTGEAMR